MPPPAASSPERPARRRAGAALALALALAVLGAALALARHGTEHPPAIAAGELEEARTFPYFRVYWVGPSFDGYPLAAADGLKGYIPRVGDTVYYGDCVQGKGIFGGGSCPLPLKVTTVVYALHSNAPLGPQRNMLLRGVPATVYDGGRSIEINTGRVTIDVFSDTLAHALRASRQLRPLNAPGSASGPLPPPVYCPGLSGPVGAHLAHVMASLPGHACQRTAAARASRERIAG